MASVTSCVDQDRDLKFDRPAGWDVDVCHGVEGGSNMLAIWSPAAPGGGPGVLVTVDVVRHDDGDLLTHVTDRLQYQSKREHYVLRGRSSGRHSATGRPAINVTYDVRLDTTMNRVEMTFIEAADGLVISASALCPLADRRLWREGCRVIFGSLRLADPDRPPTPHGDRCMGVGLPAGCSVAVQRLWLVLDHWARAIIEVNSQSIQQDTEKSLGAAAHFEARVYLLFEMMMVMFDQKYPAERTDAILNLFQRAIAGKYPPEPVPRTSPHARFQERIRTYMTSMVEGQEHRTFSDHRHLLFAELVTTSGRGNSPAVIDPATTSGRWDRVTPEKKCVWRNYPHVVVPFIVSATHLFLVTPNIDDLDEAEVDRRLTRARCQADKITQQMVEAG